MVHISILSFIESNGRFAAQQSAHLTHQRKAFPLRASECEDIHKGQEEKDMYVYFLHRIALILHLY